MPWGELLAHTLVDAHVHLGFFERPEEVARQAAALDLALFSCAVTPGEYLAMRELVAGHENVRQGLGLHPWWVDDGRCSDADVERFLGLVEETSWIGEVGVDLSRRCHDHERQLAVFERVCSAVARCGGRVMSIHAVRAVTPVLDTLERCGCSASCTCVLHWFSGSTEELWRAIRMGCLFSVNEMQARTRRATEQLRLIPESQLLFETDLPPQEGSALTAADIAASLARARELTQAIRSRR